MSDTQPTSFDPIAQTITILVGLTLCVGLYGVVGALGGGVMLGAATAALCGFTFGVLLFVPLANRFGSKLS